MVDTWATVGSCAQVGRNVHLSGGVGIGGVLEPLQARPTIIEDDCFIGARSEVVEGVIVERGAVLSMGVFIGASTRIYDRETREITYGRVPAGSVVVPGNLPAADGSHSLVLRGHRQESRRADSRENLHQRTAADVSRRRARDAGGTPLARAGTYALARGPAPARARTARRTRRRARAWRGARERARKVPARARGHPAGSRARRTRASAADTVKSRGCQRRSSSRKS